MRKIETPHINDKGYETHPAFGVVGLTRSTGGPTSLFQSDLKHQHSVRLVVSAAERKRDINHDYVHPTDTLIELEMSPAQWGALVSSMGDGRGTPVTLRRRSDSRALPVPDIPHQPRIAENLNEVEGFAKRMVAELNEAISDLEQKVEAKSGIRAVRESLRNLKMKAAHLPSNAKFVTSSLKRAAEATVTQAKAEIEEHILQKQIPGQTLEAPGLGVTKEVESGD